MGFGRDGEWTDLDAFVGSTGRLGVVWGPRRVGKSTLLAALADAAGGVYYEATRQDPTLARAELGRLLSQPTSGAALRLDDWPEAIAAALSRPVVTVLDEFGYLCDGSPELPSVIQRSIDMARRSRAATGKLLLCGSSVAQLSNLLARDQPLFGRAQLALVINAFDYRQAAGVLESRSPTSAGRGVAYGRRGACGLPRHRRRCAAFDARLRRMAVQSSAVTGVAVARGGQPGLPGDGARRQRLPVNPRRGRGGRADASHIRAQRAAPLPRWRDQSTA